MEEQVGGIFCQKIGKNINILSRTGWKSDDFCRWIEKKSALTDYFRPKIIIYSANIQPWPQELPRSQDLGEFKQSIPIQHLNGIDTSGERGGDDDEEYESDKDMNEITKELLDLVKSEDELLAENMQVISHLQVILSSDWSILSRLSSIGQYC